MSPTNVSFRFTSSKSKRAMAVTPTLIREAETKGRVYWTARRQIG
jgi:hypothetical protein